MKESDQESVRFRPRIGRIISLLHAHRGHLTTLAEAKNGRPCTGQHHVGLRYVPITSIKGTLQRPYDFDQNFRLTQNHTRRRWESVNRAAEQGIDLPPVQLLKYGEDYFVSDGHHRVSVARYRGGQWVDAEVTEVCPSPES
jgi:hypothetical protein